MSPSGDSHSRPEKPLSHAQVPLTHRPLPEQLDPVLRESHVDEPVCKEQSVPAQPASQAHVLLPTRAFDKQEPCPLQLFGQARISAALTESAQIGPVHPWSHMQVALPAWFSHVPCPEQAVSSSSVQRCKVSQERPS